MKLNPRFLMEKFREGKKPEQLVEEKIASKNTVYKYWKRFKLYKELNEKLWDVIIESL